MFSLPILANTCTTALFKPSPQQALLDGSLTRHITVRLYSRDPASLLCIPVTDTTCLLEGKDVHGLMVIRHRVPFQTFQVRQTFFILASIPIQIIFGKAILRILLFVLKKQNKKG